MYSEKRHDLIARLRAILVNKMRKVTNDLYDKYYGQIGLEQDFAWNDAVEGALKELMTEAENDREELKEMLDDGIEPANK